MDAVTVDFGPVAAFVRCLARACVNFSACPAGEGAAAGKAGVGIGKGDEGFIYCAAATFFADSKAVIGAKCFSSLGDSGVVYVAVVSYLPLDMVYAAVLWRFCASSIVGWCGDLFCLPMFMLILVEDDVGG